MVAIQLHLAAGAMNVQIATDFRRGKQRRRGHRQKALALKRSRSHGDTSGPKSLRKTAELAKSSTSQAATCFRRGRAVVHPAAATVTTGRVDTTEVGGRQSEIQ